MDITFLIGNGFDIAMGLSTSYLDFHKHYTGDKLNHNDCLFDFKDEIEADLSTWADAELALGSYTRKFSISAFDDFKKCSDDFRLNLAKYLKEQDDSFDVDAYKSILVPNFKKAVLSFPSFLLPKPRKEIVALLLKLRQEHRNFNFINFNYTTVFDRSIKLIADGSLIQTRNEGANNFRDNLNSIVHIHGTDTSKLIMGVNDESQIENSNFLSIRKLRRSLIKPEANEANHLGNDEVCSQLIMNSRIIIVFGMSLGETDKTWWKQIKSWLSMDKERYLILFMHKRGYDDTIQSNYLEAEEEFEETFFKNADATIEEQNTLRSRILININMALFGEDPRN